MRYRSRWLVLLVMFVMLVIASGAPVSAQNVAPPKVEKPAGQPPPPLFPKHRRGLYINNDNLEVIDATPQSPPLETDDPSVPDKGEYEINLLTAADFAVDARSVDVVTVDANYGIVLKGFGHELPTQIKFEFPVVARREAARPYQIGLGDSAFGLKFNFYNDEGRGVRMSVYPQIEFSTGGSVDKGIADAGQTIVFPILMSYQSKYVTLVGNAGVDKAINDPERGTTAELGFGMGRAFFRKLAVMGELRSQSTTDFKHDRLVSANAGFIYGVRKAIWYARVGHSLFSDDGRHAFVGFGMKVMIDTEEKTGARP